ncbi:MAG: hypothetical protein WBF77_08135 [Sulfurimonadaceae bacterium]
MTDEKNATKGRDLIRDTVLIEQYDGNLVKMNKELNFKTAYNQTYGFSGDIYEAYLQLANESDGWLSFYGFISYVFGNTGNDSDWYNQALALITEDMTEAMIKQAYEADLSVQIRDYKDSISLGHGVIVVSHSQGNLFTNDAYKNVTQNDGSWRKNYFTAVAVASPATKLLEDDNKDPHIGFDNDLVAWLGTLGITDNPNRSYKYINALGELVENSFDLQFHLFDYYMGEHIIFQDGVSERNISTDIGKSIIMSFLSDAIINHKEAPSQWQTNQESEKDTIGYRITVKHRFDDSVIMNEEVYPFAPSKKLYPVNGEYVKASCGGTKISASWEGQEDSEFYLLEGTGEKISALHFFIENFEDNTFGWTNNNRDSSTGLTTFLGRFGGSHGAQEISKTYSFGEAYKNRQIVITFDMYQIDSWDGDSYFNQTYENGVEKFQVYINDQLVKEDIYKFGQWYDNSSQTAGNEFFGWGSEIIHYYELNSITDENGDVKLGFGSTLHQEINDESYGIDNIKIELVSN